MIAASGWSPGERFTVTRAEVRAVARSPAHRSVNALRRPARSGSFSGSQFTNFSAGPGAWAGTDAQTLE